jgi:hypothetical protein
MDWLVGEYQNTEQQAVSEIGRSMEGWMDGRCRLEDEGKELLGAEFVMEASRQWRQRCQMGTTNGVKANVYRDGMTVFPYCTL